MAIGLLIFSIILIVIGIVSNQDRDKSSKTDDNRHYSRDESYGSHHSGEYRISDGGDVGGREGSHSHSDGGNDGGGGDGGG